MNSLQRLTDEIKKGCIWEKMLFHQDHALVHIPVIVMTNIKRLRFELLPFAGYLPNLVPSVYHLFPNLKKSSMVKDLLTMKNWSLR